ncbi:MAG: hypothetical protein ACOY30_04105 [Bacillota bacterium]
MVVRKQAVQEVAPLSSNIEVVAGRVKKDIAWVVVSVAVSIVVGLAVGNLFKF